ncbi:MAG: PAS domain S-box protein [Desulfatirhabdiaceae bacterium]
MATKPTYEELEKRVHDLESSIKSHPAPERGITYAVAHDITRHRKTEKRLRASEERFRAIFESAPVGMAVIDTQRRFIQVNDQLCRILGYDADELTGRSFNEFTHPDDREGGRERWRQLMNRELAFNQAEKRYIHKDGRIIWTIANNALISAKNGEPLYMISHLVDISAWKQTEEDRLKLEEQLRQAHKMESVGRLAGGVAHDFNNRLQAILSYTELALLDAGQDNPIEKKLLEIQKSALGAADLTRQLLAFARKQTINPRILDMNETVSGMLNMLKRLIGENIDLVWKPGLNIGAVQMDPSQIDQILINLVINARDAIDGVGNLTIETDNITFDESYCAQHAGFHAGDYVLLAVSDTGCGISREILSHIFEPFFTTKDLGKGTGLGLATVYGIVKQNNGFINVYSEPDSGTTFRIYLPRVQHPEDHASVSVIQQHSLHGNEIVLLVEDDEVILDISQTILEKYGYTVLLAGTPQQAIAIAGDYDGPIHLLVTDVIMPGMNGQELMNRIHAIKPTIKTLFMSGYTANVIVHHGVLDKGVNFLQKPFSVKTLVERVRKILDKR